MARNKLKAALSAPMAFLHRILVRMEKGWTQLRAFASLRGSLTVPLPVSTVVMGHVAVHGTGKIRCGESMLIYPQQYMETQGDAEIVLGDGVVLSSGVHLVAYAGIRIGKGSMIGEYSSIRDANHTREAGIRLRDAGHSAKPIVIGEEVWIGRGAAVLSGVTIGDRATIGANAVVTKDVPPGTVVGGVPATPLKRKVSLIPENHE